MKNILTVLLAVTAFSLLFLATKTYSLVGVPPDLLSVECANPSDRTYFRSQRNACDDEATRLGYNVGIFRPYNEIIDGSVNIICSIGSAPFSCLGAPHQ
jgi:hypothetical protein